MDRQRQSSLGLVFEDDRCNLRYSPEDSCGDTPVVAVSLDDEEQMRCARHVGERPVTLPENRQWTDEFLHPYGF